MEGENFFLSFFLAMLVVVGFNSCSPVSDGVLPADYEKAVGACENGDGVAKVYRPNYVSHKFRVLCKDSREVWFTSDIAKK